MGTKRLHLHRTSYKFCSIRHRAILLQLISLQSAQNGAQDLIIQKYCLLSEQYFSLSLEFYVQCPIKCNTDVENILCILHRSCVKMILISIILTRHIFYGHNSQYLDFLWHVMTSLWDPFEKYSAQEMIGSVKPLGKKIKHLIIVYC